jgi:prepilin-type N-terminal cleavage/methylation domain-containing protein
MDDLYMKVARRRRRGEGGFTLIELLVVIAVLAVLAFIVIFNVTGVANRGNAAACATDVQSVQTAVDSYVNDGTLPVIAAPVKPLVAGSALWGQLVPNYLHTAPNLTECATTAMNIAYANGTNATNGYTVAGA